MYLPSELVAKATADCPVINLNMGRDDEEKHHECESSFVFLN